MKKCSADLYFQFFFLSLSLSLSLCDEALDISSLERMLQLLLSLDSVTAQQGSFDLRKEGEEQLPFRSLGRQRQYYSMSLRSQGSADGACRAPVRLKQLAASCPCLRVPVMVKPPPTRPLSLFHKVSFTLHLPVWHPTSPPPPVCHTVLIICTVYSLLIGIVSLRVRLGVTYVAGTAAEHGQEMLMSFGANNDASPQPLCLFKKETDLDQ